MNICLVGPWFKREGISAYHRGLCEALIDQGHHVVVWCPWDSEDYETYPIEALKGNYTKNKEEIKACDVVHIQSENIYSEPGFSYLNQLLSDGPPAVQTLHSNCNHYLPQVKKFFVHNTPELFQKIWMVDVGPKMMKVPMWCPKVEYVDPPEDKKIWIRWKNNGRTDVKYLEEHIERVNSVLDRGYELDLTEEWMDDEDYIKYLQTSNVFTPLYHELDAVASSNAFTWMAACGRPMLVSDTHWFEGLVNNTAYSVEKLKGAACLYLMAIAIKYDDYMKEAKKEAERMQLEDTWESLADRIYIPTYKEVLK